MTLCCLPLLNGRILLGSWQNSPFLTLYSHINNERYLLSAYCIQSTVLGVLRHPPVYPHNRFSMTAINAYIFHMKN